MRLVDMDEVEKSWELELRANFSDDYGKGFRAGLTAVIRHPAIEVEPVKRGRWDEIPNRYMSVSGKDGSYSGHATSCSVCHEVNPNAFKTNYCPNCGAKMDGGDDE